MTVELLTVLAVIGTLSVIQSIFGMGILVFGTPTLLLMGYDFISTLGYLLPASFAISFLQVVTAGSGRVYISRHLYTLCLPGIAVGLWCAEFSQIATWANILIGGTLLLSALVRFWSPARQIFTFLLDSHLPTYHLIMGITHGLTNLGGAMLAILASGTNTEKEAIRYTIAHYYLAFSTAQLLVLTITIGPNDFFNANLLTAAVSSTIYLFVGNRIFNNTNNPTFNTALTLFTAIYGVVVLFKA